MWNGREGAADRRAHAHLTVFPTSHPKNRHRSAFDKKKKKEATGPTSSPAYRTTLTNFIDDAPATATAATAPPQDRCHWSLSALSLPFLGKSRSENTGDDKYLGVFLFRTDDPIGLHNWNFDEHRCFAYTIPPVVFGGRPKFTVVYIDDFVHIVLLTLLGN